MNAPKQVEHAPFPETDAEKEWTMDAQKVSRGIKPNINYQVEYGPRVFNFRGTETAQKNLKENVRLIAWYRDQIEHVCPEPQKGEGTYALAELIDEYLAEIADSVPQVKVKTSGRMNIPRDQKLEYSPQ